MSVTDISQKFEKKKNLHFLSNHFQMYQSFIALLLLLLFLRISLIHLSDSLNPPSEECSTLLVLVNKKQKQQRFHTSVKKKTTKAAFALVRLPQQGNKHSYNLLRSTAIDRSRPCVGEPGPRALGTRQPGKSLCSPKSTSYMFSREKQKRYSFTGKIHNPKLRKCQGDQAAGISGRQIRCG